MEENEVSIFYENSSDIPKGIIPKCIATLANENALPDLELFLLSLKLWNKTPPRIYLGCNKNVEKKVIQIVEKIQYTEWIRFNHCLEPYGAMNRSQMEQAPSQKGYPNLFYDFTIEKTYLMEWALDQEKNSQDGVLFCDADICWLGPLPEIIAKARFGVSPHGIRKQDENKYGIYNAGFLWTNSQDLIQKWREFSKTSTFFEQMSIQDVVFSIKFHDFHMFKTQYNYGWWRMFQSSSSIETKKKEWSIFRSETEDSNSGIRVQGQPLACIHTHFAEKQDTITCLFNTFVLEKLELLANQKKHKAHKKIQILLDYIKTI